MTGLWRWGDRTQVSQRRAGASLVQRLDASQVWPAHQVSGRGTRARQTEGDRTLGASGHHWPGTSGRSKGALGAYWSWPDSERRYGRSILSVHPITLWLRELMDLTIENQWIRFKALTRGKHRVTGLTRPDAGVRPVTPRAPNSSLLLGTL
jgi:hypothetical protein